jgi:hypothetical protein
VDLPSCSEFSRCRKLRPTTSRADLNRRIHAGSGHIRLIDAGKIAPPQFTWRFRTGLRCPHREGFDLVRTLIRHYLNFAILRTVSAIICSGYDYTIRR